MEEGGGESAQSSWDLSLDEQTVLPSWWLKCWWSDTVERPEVEI